MTEHQKLAIVLEFTGYTYAAGSHYDRNVTFGDKYDPYSYYCLGDKCILLKDIVIDWNWLMRAVITYYDKAMLSTDPFFRGKASHLVSTLTSLNRTLVYDTIVEACEWYNKH